MRISDWSSDVCSSDLPLVVAVLLAWILAVTNEHDPLLHIDVAPADTADLLLAHRAGEREAHDAAHRDDRIAVVVEVVEQAPDLVGCRPPVALARFVNQAQALDRKSAR